MLNKTGSLVTILFMLTTVATADEVTDWNQTMLQAAHAGATSPLVITRNAAIVQGAIFDAVMSGIT